MNGENSPERNPLKRSGLGGSISDIENFEINLKANKGEAQQRSIKQVFSIIKEVIRKEIEHLIVINQ